MFPVAVAPYVNVVEHPADGAEGVLVDAVEDQIVAVFLDVPHGDENSASGQQGRSLCGGRVADHGEKSEALQVSSCCRPRWTAAAAGHALEEEVRAGF
jgi:hypothetical protein